MKKLLPTVIALGVFYASCAPTPAKLKTPLTPAQVQAAAESAALTRQLEKQVQRDRQALGLANYFYTVPYEGHRWVVFTGGKEHDDSLHSFYGYSYSCQHHPDCDTLEVAKALANELAMQVNEAKTKPRETS